MAARPRTGIVVALTTLVAVLGLVTVVLPDRTERPNVVLVVLDTVRGDFTTAAGGTDDLTPNLRRLAERGTVFTRVRANAPWTVPSHASLFTGLLPSEHGCTSRNVRLETREATIAELLRNEGYETAAFYSNPWLSDRATGLLRGFDGRQESGRPGGPTILTSDHGGPETVRRINHWLERGRRAPFFMFVNILEAHLPYDPPADYRMSRLDGATRTDVVSVNWAQRYNAGVKPRHWQDKDRLRELYGGDVNTSDRLLGALLEALEAGGLIDDTIVIVTSDHGENLGDHSIVGHQFGVHETLLDVPLIVYAPGLLPPGVRNDPVMLTDIFATIAEAARVEHVPPRLHSRSLLHGRADADRPLISEYAGAQPGLLARLGSMNPDLDCVRLGAAYSAVRVGDLKLTVSSYGSSVLSDLSGSSDEALDLSKERPEDALRLRQLLPARARERSPNRRDSRGPDEETRRRLSTLGYLQ